MTNENVEPQDPQPPYPFPMPPRWADVPFDELPHGLQRRVLALMDKEAENG